MHDGVVTISTCYPVPHVEKTGDDVKIGKDFNRTMLALHQSVNPRDKVVGWYATSCQGVDINDTSVLIHEYYGTECKLPVHLIVDTSLVSNNVTMKAFSSLPVVMGDT